MVGIGPRRVPAQRLVYHSSNPHTEIRPDSAKNSRERSDSSAPGIITGVEVLMIAVDDEYRSSEAEATSATVFDTFQNRHSKKILWTDGPVDFNLTVRYLRQRLSC
jgi:hypothetical protein